MANPSILNSLYVDFATRTEYGVFTKAPIYRGSIVEICSWIPVTQKTYFYLENNNQTVSDRMFENPDGIKKEKEFLLKLTELELQEKLDAGIITGKQFNQMLLSVMNPANLLNINSHAILLGFGSIYRRSDRPNLNWEYDTSSKLYKFFAVEDIRQDQELTYFSK